MFGRVGFQTVRRAERLLAIGDLASERLLSRVRPRVRLEMVRCGERLLATGSEATERTLAGVSAHVLAKITKVVGKETRLIKKRGKDENVGSEVRDHSSTLLSTVHSRVSFLT